jgi:hypothetical protein
MNRKLFLALEAERLDISYRQPKTHAPKPEPLMGKQAQKLWFDAGRAAQGATDKDAVLAWKRVKKITGWK